MSRREKYLRLPPTAKPKVCAVGLTETYDWALTSDGIPDLWKQTRGKGVKIAGLDTGVDDKHPDLIGQVRDAKDFTGSRIGHRDSHGHGTFISGQLVAKCGNNIGTAGICYEAEYRHYKVLSDNGSGSEQAIGAGFQAARADGNHIASASFGGRGMSRWLYDLLKELHDDGMMMFFAAGNDSGPVNEPAAWPWGIAVGASDEDGRLTDFTSKIGRLDIVAPGVKRTSTLPGGRYGEMAGTSMACPHAGGVGALALSKHMQAGGASDLRNRADMVDHLRKTAADRGKYKLLNPRRLLEEHGVATQPAVERDLVAELPWRYELWRRRQ